MPCPHCRALAIENEKLKAEMDEKMKWAKDQFGWAAAQVRLAEADKRTLWVEKVNLEAKLRSLGELE